VSYKNTYEILSNSKNSIVLRFSKLTFFNMEKFMFLFRGSDVYQPDQSPEALQVLTQKMMDWLGELSGTGAHVASERLKRTGRQVSGAKKTLTDLPFGEEREVVGGCTIVQAEDIHDAVEIAKRCPILETNATIEIRPILSI
jgi:hypothetical protein